MLHYYKITKAGPLSEPHGVVVDPKRFSLFIYCELSLSVNLKKDKG